MLVLVFISLILLGLRFINQAPLFFAVQQRSGVRVLSLPEGAKVYIDQKEVGVTPYENQELSPQEYLVKLENGQGKWEGKVKLIPGTLTVVNRELGKEAVSSAGEVLTLEKGKGLIITSNPSESEVEVNGKYYGKTPLTIDVPAGEYTASLSHSNYLKRSIRANVPDQYRLTVVVDLGLSEVDLTSTTTPVTTVTPMVVVKSTPTGFLRVRDRASTAGKEIGRVSPGDELVLLEEGSEWDRVRLPDGKTEGYVSKAYVEKKNP